MTVIDEYNELKNYMIFVDTVNEIARQRKISRWEICEKMGKTKKDYLKAVKKLENRLPMYYCGYKTEAIYYPQKRCWIAGFTLPHIIEPFGFERLTFAETYHEFANLIDEYAEGPGPYADDSGLEKANEDSN